MLRNVLSNKEFNNLSLTREGWMLFNKNDVLVGRSLKEYGEYCHGEVELYKQLLAPEDIVIEVGANTGALTLPISKLIGPKGRVYALEPQRIVFQTLCANMAINSCTNAFCLEIGASNDNSILSKFYINYDEKANFGAVALAALPEGGEKIKLAKLDNIFEDLDKLKLIKIDVEGMEREVIIGAKILIERLAPLIYIENDKIDKSRLLIETIKSFDYRLYWHRVPYFNKENYANKSENIFPDQVAINMLCVPARIQINIEGMDEICNSNFHPIFGEVP